MLPAFLACCNELVDRWEKHISSSVEPTELDVWPEFQNLSGDVISRAAFGVGYEEGRRIFLLQAEQAERLVQSFRINYIPGFSYGSKCYNSTTQLCTIALSKKKFLHFSKTKFLFYKRKQYAFLN
jgi:hypothetical protein